MKNVLIRIPDSAAPERLTEAVRVAAGLSQQPGLGVSLQLPPLPPVHAESRLQEYFVLFAEKGVRVHAGPRWRPLLPPVLHPLQSSAGPQDPACFDLVIPF